MSENDDHPPEKSSTEKLAELVAKRKAGLNAGPAAAHNGRRGAERTAAALSASKSKPALRK